MRNPNGYGSVTRLKGKRRRPWWVRITTGWITDETRGRRRQTFATLGFYATKKESLQALAEYNDNPYDLAKKDITFADAVEKWKQSDKYRNLAESSKANYRAAFNHCAPLHDLPMRDIRLAHLQKIMEATTEMSKQSQDKIKTLMKRAFAVSIANDIIQKDYSAFVSTTTRKETKKKMPFTFDEIQKIRENQDSSLAYTVLLLLYTGLRINELLNQKTADIDTTQKIIYVNGTKNRSAKRIVPIHSDILPIISARIDGEHLIEADGKKLNYDKYIDFWEKYMPTISKKRHTPHDTRHTFVSAMDKCGVERLTLKRIVGHKTDDITDHYSHRDIRDLHRAISLLDFENM